MPSTPRGCWTDEVHGTVVPTSWGPLTRLFRCIALAALMLAPATVTASAATYLVAPTGSDCAEGPPACGTEAKPWRTIQHAANLVAPGDYVVIEPGTYAEDVKLTRSGTASQRINFLGPHVFEATKTNVRSYTVAASYVTVYHQRIEGAGNACILVEGGLSGVVLADNPINNCGGAGIENRGSAITEWGNTITNVNLGGAWKPAQHLSWYSQLQGTLPAMTGTGAAAKATAWDVDGFNTSAATVGALHAAGHRAICYIDVGTAENFRPDYSQFPSADLGKTNGWPGERWLNINDPAIRPILAARFSMCREKGFDGVEPDNTDGYENSTGFSISGAQQLTFNRWIAEAVHALGMAVFQKNDGEQTPSLLSSFDGAIDEQCNQYQECALFNPYLAAGKPVLNAEYSLATGSFCAADNAAGMMGARFALELDGTRFEPCWP